MMSQIVTMLSVVSSAMAETKQVGIRLPVALWRRTLVVAASAGKKPGAYVAEVLERSVAQGERALLTRLTPRGSARRGVSRGK